MRNFFILFLLTVTLALGEDDGSFIFNTGSLNVKLNERVHLDCGIKGEYRYCVWEHGNHIFQVEEVHEGKDPGKSKPYEIQDNQCGIVLDKVSDEDYGNWTCKIFIIGGSHVDSKNVVRKSEITKVTTVGTIKNPVTTTRESSTPKQDASTTENTGLSAGAIAGICIAVFLAVAALIVGLKFKEQIVEFFSKNDNKSDKKDGNNDENETMNSKNEKT